jgi:hypothetical protein
MSVVIGPAGVFVVGGRGADLRARLRDVRDRLDAAGLRALPATAVPNRDAVYARALADADVRFPDVIIRRAERALDVPPPFVADVLTESARAGARERQPQTGAAVSQR